MSVICGVSVSMETISLTCNNCGAPLRVPDSAKFVTCNHCDAQLAIHRNANATFTEQLDKIAETTDQLADAVTQLTRQNEIARIDREWAMEKQDYMITGKHGHRHLPNEVSSVIGGVVAVGFGIFWTIATASSSAPGFFPLFGVLFVCIGIGVSIHGFVKAQGYREAQRRYRRRRMEAQRHD